MNISVATIPPPPAPTPSTPASTTPPDSSDSSGFSQQLSRAKAKGTPPASQGNQSSQPQTNASASNNTQQTTTDTTQDKGKSKQQPQDQAAQAESATETETETQAQVTDPSSDQTEHDAELAAEAQNKQILAQARAANAAGVLPAKTSAKSTKTDSTSNKPAATDANSTANTPTDLTTLQNALASQQPAPPVDPKTPLPAKTDDSDDDAPAVKQAGSKPKISPFQAENAAAASASAGTDAESADDAAAAAEEAAQLSTKGKATADDSGQSTFADVFAQTTSQTQAPAATATHAAPAAPQTPVAQFAETNQPAIVSTIHGSLLPDGGTMNITLNPPDLGAMQISVKMENGVMSASFQTSTDQATRLLTHSLGQLKNALEIQGVSVDRLHVQQTSSSEGSGSKSGDSEGGKNQSQQDGRSPQQEEQRRETLRRMWRRIRGQGDPLDLVA